MDQSNNCGAMGILVFTYGFSLAAANSIQCLSSNLSHAPEEAYLLVDTVLVVGYRHSAACLMYILCSCASTRHACAKYLNLEFLAAQVPFEMYCHKYR